MDFVTVRTFFALLALGANVAVVGYLVLAVAGSSSRAAAGIRDRITSSIAGYEIPFAFVAALTATLGSLYLSEIVHLVPCTYCWYQRIAMYPLVLVFGVAWWRQDTSVARYAAPLASIGLAISSWHYLVQQVPSLGGGSCSVGVPCNTAYFYEFGFVSIPYMAGSTFALILVLVHMWTTSTAADPASLASA